MSHTLSGSQHQAVFQQEPCASQLRFKCVFSPFAVVSNAL